LELEKSYFFRDERLLERVLVRLLVRLRGTFAPFSRASESPIAIACLRLFTVPPLPPRPRLSVPFFRRCIALSTRLDADFPYFRPPDRLEELFRFAVAMAHPGLSWLVLTATSGKKPAS
jgi:hypothetical protein